jgi:glutaredoxin-like protein NrdH
LKDYAGLAVNSSALFFTLKHRKKKKMSITVYSKSNCVQCTQTKKTLVKLGLIENQDYEVIDVTVDAAAYDKVIAMGYKAAPVVVVGEDHWAGFQPDKLKALVS